MYDLQGRVIKNITLGASELKEVSIAELPKGLYLIKVNNSNQCYKLMVN